MVRMSAVAKRLRERVIAGAKVSFAYEMCKSAAGRAALYDSDEEAQPFQRDRPIQYRGKYSRHSPRSSADRVRVRSQYRCHMSEAVEKNNRSAVALVSLSLS